MSFRMYQREEFLDMQVKFYSPAVFKCFTLVLSPITWVVYIKFNDIGGFNIKNINFF